MVVGPFLDELGCSSGIVRVAVIGIVIDDLIQLVVFRHAFIKVGRLGRVHTQSLPKLLESGLDSPNEVLLRGVVPALGELAQTYQSLLGAEVTIRLGLIWSIQLNLSGLRLGTFD